MGGGEGRAGGGGESEGGLGLGRQDDAAPAGRRHYAATNPKDWMLRVGMPECPPRQFSAKGYVCVPPPTPPPCAQCCGESVDVA